MMLKDTLKSLLRRTGYEVVRRDETSKFPPDFSAEDVATIESVRPYTMTTPVNMFSLMRAVEYVVAAKIPGSFVECGVWRGGSMMIIAKTLLRLGVRDAHLYLYDTFEGMTVPTASDRRHDDVPAEQRFRDLEAKGEKWCYAPIEEVRRNLAQTGYDPSLIHFIKGTVEETIPSTAPERVALLRLDTDWYESTKHELEQLYPLLSPGGVLIIDDYGHWKGSRKATDEYLQQQGIVTLLQRVDHGSRLVIKAAR